MHTTHEHRLGPWLFGGGFTAVAVLLTATAVMLLTGALSSILLMQALTGGALPPTVALGAALLFVGLVMCVLGVYYIAAFN